MDNLSIENEQQIVEVIEKYIREKQVMKVIPPQVEKMVEKEEEEEVFAQDGEIEKDETTKKEEKNVKIRETQKLHQSFQDAQPTQPNLSDHEIRQILLSIRYTFLTHSELATLTSNILFKDS